MPLEITSAGLAVALSLIVQALSVAWFAVKVGSKIAGFEARTTLKLEQITSELRELKDVRDSHSADIATIRIAIAGMRHDAESRDSRCRERHHERRDSCAPAP